jgi:HAD superfamily hydrolase (TIGR01509 family)
MTMPKGLLIDLDGTLADSITPLKAVYFAFLNNFGATGSVDEFQRLNGPPLVKIIAELKAVYDLPGDPSALLNLYSSMIWRAYLTAPPAGGASEVLREARAHGWSVAVVTSSPRQVALGWLARNGLFGEVDAVVGGDEVPNGKPAPDPYVLGLSRVSCTTAFSLAVEDSRIGAMSAVSAGLSTCVVTDPNDRTGWPAEVRFISHLSDLLEILQC